MPDRVVVKVGGSLYDLDDFGPRLRAWLSVVGQNLGTQIAVVPGGGPTADVIRNLDRRHHLGEEKAHWLALQALTLNACFLASLLPHTRIVPDELLAEEAWASEAIAILDAHAFIALDEQRCPPQSLPHSWSVTSDSVAARFAQVCKATHLILLKSVSIPENQSWAEAADRQIVDPFFSTLLPGASFQVRVVNFREGPGETPVGANLG